MKNSIDVRVIHAFADNNAGGNPAGVVLDADRLTSDQKQEVARRAGLSETAFVSSSKLADFKLDFFTPNRQIPHCGHATVATFSYLKQLGKIKGDRSSKETIDGIRQIYFEGDLAFMEQGAPTFTALTDEDRVNTLKGLRIGENDLLSGYEPFIVNTGNNFLIVSVEDEGRLKNMRPDLELIEKVSAKYNLIAFYVYALGSDSDAVATTRMFGPYYGIPEEPATGMAAGPLACYLNRFGNIKNDELVITQGRFMIPPSPSRIVVRLDKENGAIKKLFAGGRAYVKQQLVVELNN